MTEDRIAIRDQASNTVANFLIKHKDQIIAALPRHLSADRMARIALTELRKTPLLLDCDPRALFGAIIQCAQLGLEPGGALGHVWILPYKNTKLRTIEPQVIIGYRGMIDLARRSGQIISISARAVHEGDDFSYSYGLEETLVHVPQADATNKPLTHVYSVARLHGGGVQFEVLSVAEVNSVRKDFGPWVDYFEEMARKTAIRRLFKYLPVSIEMNRAAVMDERGEAGLSQEHSDVLPTSQVVTLNVPVSDGDEPPDPPANGPADLGFKAPPPPAPTPIQLPKASDLLKGFWKKAAAFGVTRKGDVYEVTLARFKTEDLKTLTDAQLQETLEALAAKKAAADLANREEHPDEVAVLELARQAQAERQPGQDDDR